MFLDVTPYAWSAQFRVCKRCGEAKQLSEYYRSGSAYDKTCKQCRCEQVAAWRSANQEHVCAYEKQYTDRRRVNHKAWCEANKERRREQLRRYHAENKDAINERRRNAPALKAYHEKNKGRIAERKRKYYEENREHHLSVVRSWSKENPDKRRASRHRRRTNELTSGENFTSADLSAIRAAQTDSKGRLICWRCGKPIKGTPHLDHWIPLAKGGSNGPGNLHYMHAHCNVSKSDKLPAEIGRLL